MKASEPRPEKAAVRIALLYALAGGLWILFSDKAVQAVFSDPATVTEVAIAKGWAYVAVTSILLYLLVRRALVRIEASRDALRRSEERYRALFQGSRDALMIHELPSGRYVACNEAALELYGIDSREAFRALGPWNLSPAFQPDGQRSAEKAQAMIDEALAKGSHFFEWRARRLDGREFDATVLLTRIDTDGGVELQATVRDETERIQIQAALRESEEKYRELVENANSIIAKFDVDGRVTFLNEYGEQFFGFSEAELLGRHVVGTFVPERETSGRDLRRLMEETFIDPDRFTENEHENITRDGRRVWIHWATRAIRAPGGELLGLLAVGTDITERKRAEGERLDLERRLLHAQKLESLGILAGGIAHDFNNLLTAILGNLDVALQRVPLAFPARTNIEHAIRASLRASDLTRQMLAYSGKGQSVVAPVSLSALVEENAELFRASVSKNLTLLLRLDPDLPRIPLDPAQIQQVVMNLITNASEALDDKPGTITLSTGIKECDDAYLAQTRIQERAPAGRFAYVEVQDTGCGMDPETRQRLFDPFFTTKFAGRGLGMASVLGIVRSHRGAILLESEPGKGTSVRVLFPAGPESEGSDLADAAAPPLESGLPPLRGATILVADDEESVRTICREMLQALGYRVLIAENGLEAVEIYKAGNGISCVLLDLTMPVMDGEATLKELRRVQPDVKVLLASGFAEQQTMERFADLSLSGFLQKPYRLSELKEKLEKVLEIKDDPRPST